MSAKQVDIIQSTDNAQFKRINKLVNSARERRKTGLTVLDGTHLLTAVAEAGQQLELIVLREDAQSHKEISASIALFKNCKMVVFSRQLFDQISPVQSPVGIMAVYKPPSDKKADIQSAILLENIQDPGNLGSILRTTAAAGIEAVYLSKGCTEAWSPKVLRGGMGAHFLLKIYEQQSLESIAGMFSQCVATSLHATDSLYAIKLSGSVAFLFGNEGEGVSEQLLACATQKIKIPMPGSVESLNVAAAVAICLFERVRQLEATAR